MMSDLGNNGVHSTLGSLLSINQPTVRPHDLGRSDARLFRIVLAPQVFARRVATPRGTARCSGVLTVQMPKSYQAQGARRNGTSETDEVHPSLTGYARVSNKGETCPSSK